MYRKSAEDTYSSYLNNLNVKCFREMYLDSSIHSNSTMSPSTSTSGSPPTTPLTPSSNSYFLGKTVPQDQEQYRMMSPTMQTTTTGVGGNGSKFEDIQRRYQEQCQQVQLKRQELMQQHEQRWAAAAASVESNSSFISHPDDEISKSLQMFATITAYNNIYEKRRQQTSSVDAIMQDFACNGHVRDDFHNNQYQHYQAMCDMANRSLSNCNNDNSLPANSCANNNMLLAQQQLSNLNLANLQNNLWMTRIQQRHAAATAAAAAAVNIDYNNNYNKRPKRFNGNKNDRHSAVKHCVFCENNNEPEAVVKSHAVRDSLGRVLCPKLRTYICPICKASGDQAHTVKYCPQKPIITMEDAIKAESLRAAKGTSLSYKQVFSK